uniref:MHC class I-like antigen recognition-like domain-containing protein n=1 Tax=Periophthalmus magnuspinnatus TaxID=409849 RepID=A0A3B4AQK2_9GOBI
MMSFCFTLLLLVLSLCVFIFTEIFIKYIYFTFNVDLLPTVIHALRVLRTSSSQVPNFPEFVSVGYLDDLQITHFDSVTREYVPKQEWMKKITEEEPEYWKINRRLALGHEQVGKSQIETVKRRLDMTGGLCHFYFFHIHKQTHKHNNSTLISNVQLCK